MLLYPVWCDVLKQTVSQIEIAAQILLQETRLENREDKAWV